MDTFISSAAVWFETPRTALHLLSNI